MNVHKTCQLKDISIKIIKMNADIFANAHFNYCIVVGEFAQVFKHGDIILYIRRKKKMIKLITYLSAYYRTFLKFTKN